MKIRQLILAAFLVLAAGNLAAAALSLQLRLEPDHVPPGLPFDVRLEIANTTDRELTISNLASLVVHEASGAEFVAACGSNRRCAFPQFNSATITLAPHGRIAVSLLDWPVPTSATWLDDPRLHRPGTYQLQVLFSGANGGTSNSAKLVVEEPSGVDAAVLNDLRAAAPGAPMSVDVYRNVTAPRQIALLGKYPKSSYAPFLTTAQIDPDKPADLVVFLRGHADYAFRQLLELRIAEWHLNNVQAILHIRDNGNRQEAAREMSLAKNQYLELRHSSNPYVAGTAARFLEFIAGRDDLDGLTVAKEKKQP